MGIDEATVQDIVRRLIEAGGPVRIILFGSAALGQMTRDSDIDLLVLERSPTDIGKEMVRLRAALREIDHPIDVLVMPVDRFERTKGLIGGLAYPANKYGRVIYDAA